MKTASGLEYVEVEAGTGAQAKAGDVVRVHEVGIPWDVVALHGVGEHPRLSRARR